MGQAVRRGVVLAGVFGVTLGVCAEARGETSCLLTLCRAVDAVHRTSSPQLLDFRAPSYAVSPLMRSVDWVGRRITSGGDAERGLIEFVPLPELGPSVTLEGGTLFDVDAERLGRLFGIDSGAMERLGYSFGTAHMGIEMGRTHAFRLLIHGGLSMLQTKPCTRRGPVSGWRGVGAGRVRGSAGPRFGASGRVTFVIYL